MCVGEVECKCVALWNALFPREQQLSSAHGFEMLMLVIIRQASLKTDQAGQSQFKTLHKHERVRKV